MRTPTNAITYSQVKRLRNCILGKICGLSLFTINSKLYRLYSELQWNIFHRMGVKMSLERTVIDLNLKELFCLNGKV